MNKQICVLIVEDDRSIQEFMGSFLEDEGYCYLTADNGVEALEILKTSQPSLIILDMFMPILDGKGFVAAYQKTAGPHAPIIGMSANTPVLEPLIRASILHFINKPFHLDALLECIQQYAQSA